LTSVAMYVTSVLGEGITFSGVNRCVGEINTKSNASTVEKDS